MENQCFSASGTRHVTQDGRHDKSVTGTPDVDSQTLRTYRGALMTTSTRQSVSATHTNQLLNVSDMDPSLPSRGPRAIRVRDHRYHCGFFWEYRKSFATQPEICYL